MPAALRRPYFAFRGAAIKPAVLIVSRKILRTFPVWTLIAFACIHCCDAERRCVIATIPCPLHDRLSAMRHIVNSAVKAVPSLRKLTGFLNEAHHRICKACALPSHIL